MILFQINKGSVYRGRQQLTDEEILAIYKRLHLTNDMVQSTVGLLTQLAMPHSRVSHSATVCSAAVGVECLPTEPAVSGLIPDVIQQFFFTSALFYLSSSPCSWRFFSRLSIHLLSVQLAKSAHNLLCPSSLFSLLLELCGQVVQS